MKAFLPAALLVGLFVAAREAAPSGMQAAPTSAVAAGRNTLVTPRASVAGPSACLATPTPQGGVGCEWRNSSNNRVYLTLDEQTVTHAAPTRDSRPR